MKAHPTALVSPQADIADDVVIGPYAIIEGPVRLASGCRVAAHAQILGRVEAGPACQIGPAAILGGDPQALGFDPSTDSGVILGARNVIREHVTIHRGLREGAFTRLGDDNFLMAGAHLGHDVQAGNHNVIANNALLGGHVAVGDRCFLGGGSVYHQFVRLGDLVMVQGQAAIGLDLPPFVTADGANRVAGLNAVGLRRGGFSREDRQAVKRAYELVYRQGLNLQQALEAAGREEWPEPARRFLDFFRANSKRGVCLQVRKAGDERV